MKIQQIRILTGAFLACILASQFGFADDIRLKDGSLIKGEVIAEEAGEKMTVRRADGSENIFSMDEVESVTRTPEPTESPDDPVRVDSRSSGNRIAVKSGPPPARKFTSGLSFGIGVGAMVPTDEEAYGGIGTDLYPEFRVAGDIGPVELALSVGYVYREVQEYGSRYNYDYEMSFVPVEFHVNLLPVRFASSRSVVQPYLGIGFGGYLAVGDNEDSYGMVSPAAGVSFHLGRHNIIALDFSHHVVLGEDDDYDSSYFGGELDYTTIMIQYRVRIPFTR